MLPSQTIELRCEKRPHPVCYTFKELRGAAAQLGERYFGCLYDAGYLLGSGSQSRLRLKDVLPILHFCLQPVLDACYLSDLALKLLL